MVVNHLWLGNFESIFEDVSVTCQQHNSIKMGQGQKSEPENFKYLPPSSSPQLGSKYPLVIVGLFSRSN